MQTFNRVLLIKIHMLLAAFVFPAAVMFIITGAFYTWGITGAYFSDVQLVSLQQPLTDDQQELTDIVARELQRLSVAAPSGQAKVKKAGTSFQLEWTGAERDVVLEPTADALQAKLTIKETSWYRNFVQLHKAKGGQLFKFYAALLAVSLLVILTSGFLMAWQIPKYRNLAAVYSTAGVVVFLLMYSLS
jgi:hypothetical protein